MKNMKRLLVLLLIWALAAVSPALAADDDVVIEGVTYFNAVDMPGDSQEEFVKKLLINAAYTRDGHANASLLNRWWELALALERENNLQAFNQRYVETTTQKVPPVAIQTGSGYAMSLKGAEDALKSQISSSYPGWVRPVIGSVADKDTAPQPVVFMWSAPVISGAEPEAYVLDDYVYGYAAIMSNLRIVPVVSDKTYTQIPEATWRSAVHIDDVEFSYSNLFTNNTPVFNSQTAELAQEVSEAMRNDVSSSVVKTSSQHFEAGLDVPITQFLPEDSKLYAKFGMDWSEVWTDAWNESKMNTKKTTAKTMVSIDLPPFTTAIVKHTIGKAGVSLNYQYPVALQYDVSLVRYAIGLNHAAGSSAVFARYGADAGRNTQDARTDLNKRANNTSISDPNNLRYSSAARTLASGMYKYVPMSKQGAKMAYTQNATVQETSGLRPTQNLSRVQATGTDEYMLSPGGTLRLSSLLVGGQNASGAPYYGFNAEKGSWQILDEDGQPAVQSQVAQITSNPVTGVKQLKALSPGTVYLKYLIDEQTYKRVEKDAYILNRDLTETAYITVDVAVKNEMFTIDASGKVTGSVGDVIDLDQLGAVAVSVRDAAGEARGVHVTWETDTPDALLIEEGALLTLKKTGDYRIRAVWDDLASEWLPVSVREARALASLKLSDPAGLLKSFEWEGVPSQYALDQLTLEFLDQYSEVIPASAVSWYVEPDGDTAYILDDVLTVSGPGKFRVCAKVGALTSNSLTLEVTGKEAFALNAEKIDLVVGEQFHLFATPPLSGGDAYTFKSTKPTVAQVDENGLVTALKKGNAAIRVSDPSGKTETCQVNVAEAPQAVGLNPAKAVLGVGERLELACESANGKIRLQAAYQSSDPSVARVDQASGIVTALTKGNAVVTATCVNGLTATCALEVRPAPTALNVEGPRLTMGVGEKRAIPYRLEPDGAAGRVGLISSDEKLIEITPLGLAHARKRGEGRLTLRSYNGLEQTLTVEILKKPGRITLDAREFSLTVGAQRQLTATLPAGCGGSYVFSSSKPGVARVDQDGLVTAVADGKTVISVKTYNGKVARATVTVGSGEPSAVTLAAKKSIKQGETVKLKPTIKPAAARGATLIYTSDNPYVAVVDQSGQVTGLTLGSATIRAQAQNGVFAECLVTVTKNAVRSVSVKPQRKTITVNEALQLTATAKPQNAPDRALIWRSSNEGVATVDANGLVRAIAPGKAVITAEAPSGKKGKCTVTVKNP